MRTPWALLKFAGRAICNYVGVTLLGEFVFGVFPEICRDIQELMERARARGDGQVPSEKARELLDRLGPATVQLYDEHKNAFDIRLPEFANLVWENWKWGKTQEQLRDELRQFAQASDEDIRLQVRQVLKEIADHEPEVIQRAMARYLEAFGRKVRDMLVHPAVDRSAGERVPIQRGSDLLRILPTLQEAKTVGFGGPFHPSAVPVSTTGDACATAAKSSGEPFGPRLVVLEGRRKDVVYFLREGRNVIGRCLDGTVDIDLTEQETPEWAAVSRRHAVIVVQQLAMYIEDLGSSNGTFINHHRVQPAKKCPIGIDDILTLGTVKLIVAK